MRGSPLGEREVAGPCSSGSHSLWDGLHLDLAMVARPEGVIGAPSVHALVGVGAEQVSQPLEQGGRQAIGAQGVVVRECSGKAGHRYTGGRCQRDHASPAVLGPAEVGGNLGIGEQGGQPAALVGPPDSVQQPRPDDASPSPDAGHLRKVHVPSTGLAGGADLVEPLRVGDDLGGPECRADVLDELTGRLGRSAGRTLEGSPRCLSQLGMPGGRTGEHRLGDDVHGHARDRGPSGPSTSRFPSGRRRP